MISSNEPSSINHQIQSSSFSNPSFDEQTTLFQRLARATLKSEILIECAYCHIDNKKILAKCNNCGFYFCNGFSQGILDTHIINHLKKSHHNSISRYPHHLELKCAECHQKNIFDLNIYEGKILCSQCLKSNEGNVYKIVYNNTAIHPTYVKGPSERQDIEKNLSCSAKYIDLLQYEFQHFDEANKIALKHVKQCYMSIYDYYETYKSLNFAEKEYYIKLTEHQPEYTVHLTFKKIEYSILAEFNQNLIQNREIEFSYRSQVEVKKDNFSFVATIIKKCDGIITICFPSFSGEIPFEDGNYVIKLKGNMIGFNRRLQGLDMLISNNTTINFIISSKIILGDPRQFPLDIFKLEEINYDFKIPELPELNESQKNSLKYCLTHNFSLIQGPPGTGKTLLASYLVYYFVKFKKIKGKILVCAPSNLAVNHLTEQISKISDLKVIRVCSAAREFEKTNIDELTLHWKLDRMPFKKFRKLHEKNKLLGYLKGNDKIEYTTLLRKYEEDLLKSSDIVITTCNSSFDDRLNILNFPIVLIDEASQAYEAECILPLLHGAKHVVLIGDQRQLGPIVYSKKCKNYGMSISLFERMQKNINEQNVLNIQYRMHPFLNEFSSKIFYNEKVISLNKKFNLCEDFPWPNKEKPTFFYNVLNIQKEELSENGISYFNSYEAEKIKEISITLIQSGVDGKDIGIITPYLGQKNYLKKIMSNTIFNQIEIESVDSFQGREKDYIIISTVRKNDEGIIGFLAEPRRLNVSLTRAKNGLIIIGNASTLAKTNNLWKTLIKFYQDNNLLVCGENIYKLIPQKIFKEDEKIPPIIFEEFNYEKGKNEQLYFDYQIVYKNFDYWENYIYNNKYENDNNSDSNQSSFSFDKISETSNSESNINSSISSFIASSISHKNSENISISKNSFNNSNINSNNNINEEKKNKI